MTDIQPNIYGSSQPVANTWTLVTRLPEDTNGFLNVFISTQTWLDRVRMVVKPADVEQADQHYVLYDTPIRDGYPVQISNIGMEGNHEILVWSELGETSFNVTGVTLVNDPI